jgi:hypothetical protein
MRTGTTFFMVALGASVLVSTLVVLLGALCGGAIPLAEGETCAQCVREWVGATSGWFAAAIAAAIAFPQITQIRHTLQDLQATRQKELLRYYGERMEKYIDKRRRFQAAVNLLRDEAVNAVKSAGGVDRVTLTELNNLRGSIELRFDEIMPLSDLLLAWPNDPSAPDISARFHEAHIAVTTFTGLISAVHANQPFGGTLPLSPQAAFERFLTYSGTAITADEVLFQSIHLLIKYEA